MGRRRCEYCCSGVAACGDVGGIVNGIVAVRASDARRRSR